MAFVNYNQKDDMQEDIYSILSELFIDAIRSYRNTDIQMMYRDIDSIYILTHSRLQKNLSDDFEKRLDKISTALFSIPEGEEARPILLSTCFDDLRGLMKELSKALDEAGILFKMQAKLDQLVAQ